MKLFVLRFELDPRWNRVRHGSLGSGHDDRVTFDIDLDLVRDRYGFLSNSRHL